MERSVLTSLALELQVRTTLGHKVCLEVSLSHDVWPRFPWIRCELRNEDQSMSDLGMICLGSQRQAVLE